VGRTEQRQQIRGAQHGQAFLGNIRLHALFLSITHMFACL
jgi:hypothetical protein